MQDQIIEPLSEVAVVRLLKFIRQEEDNEHIAQLCADVSSEFAHVARYVGKVGFSLSEEWKTADHLVLNVKDYKTRVLAIHIRAAGNHDDQKIDISNTVLRARRETAKTSFSLPEQFDVAKNHIMGQLFSAFPADRLVLPISPKEKVPLFEEVKIALPRTWDEGRIKDNALKAANEEGEGKMFRTPYASDAPRRLGFGR